MTITTRPIGLPIEEPSLATWWPGLDVPFTDAAGGQVVALGRATESDASRALDASRTAALGSASESDAGRGIISAKVVPIGRALESSAARNLSQPGVPGGEGVVIVIPARVRGIVVPEPVRGIAIPAEPRKIVIGC